MHKQISDRKLAANRSNAQKSTGPKTRARASLNSFKYGAYANLDSRHGEIMLRGGEELAQTTLFVLRLLARRKTITKGGRGGLRGRDDGRKNGPKRPNEPSK
jgi:hypothetical protein